MKIFSVVIPNLHSPIVDRTIAALEHQTLDHHLYEIVVVGMDKYGLIHENDAVCFDRSEAPLAPARARNRGVNRTTGEIIAFTDSDCIPSPDWLTVLAQRFADPSVTVVGGGVEFDTKNYWMLADNLSMFYQFLSCHPAGQRSQLPSLNLAIRRSVFERIGGFDERYPRPSGEDSDLTIRLRKAGHTLHFDPSAVVFHAPQRNSSFDLLRHSYYQGKYSTKVDPRYVSEKDSFPWPINTRAGVIIAALFLATGATLRIFSSHRYIRQFWYTAPAILASKLTWCIGAAARPKYL